MHRAEQPPHGYTERDNNQLDICSQKTSFNKQDRGQACSVEYTEVIHVGEEQHSCGRYRGLCVSNCSSTQQVLTAD